MTRKKPKNASIIEKQRFQIAKKFKECEKCKNGKKGKKCLERKNA